MFFEIKKEVDELEKYFATPLRSRNTYLEIEKMWKNGKIHNIDRSNMHKCLVKRDEFYRGRLSGLKEVLKNEA